MRGAGGWGHSFALFFPAGTGKGGSAFSRVGQGWLEPSFTRRHWRQVAVEQVTHTLILWAAQVCALLEASHFTWATRGSSGCGTRLGSAVNLSPTEAHTDLTGLMVWDPGLQELMSNSILANTLSAGLLGDTAAFQKNLVLGTEAAF